MTFGLIRLGNLRRGDEVMVSLCDLSGSRIPGVDIDAVLEAQQAALG